MPITAVAFDFGGVLSRSPSEALDDYAAELGLPAGTFLPFFRGDERMAAFCHTAGTLSEFVWQKLQGVQPAVPDLLRLSHEVWETLRAAPGQRWWYFGAGWGEFPCI